MKKIKINWDEALEAYWSETVVKFPTLKEILYAIRDRNSLQIIMWTICLKPKTDYESHLLSMIKNSIKKLRD